MFVMYDSVDVGLIPNAPHAVLGYVNGDFVTVPELRKRFPHARVAELSVTGMVPAHGYDIEKGDYTPEQAADLYQLSANAGNWRPLFYAQLSNMPAVKASLETVIPNRDAVRLMVAAWDGIALVPAGYDAKQFTNRALGRNLDESVCADTFFPAAKPVADLAWEARVSVDPDTKTWAISPLPQGDVKP